MNNEDIGERKEPEAPMQTFINSNGSHIAIIRQCKHVACMYRVTYTCIPLVCSYPSVMDSYLDEAAKVKTPFFFIESDARGPSRSKLHYPCGNYNGTATIWPAFPGIETSTFFACLHSV